MSNLTVNDILNEREVGSVIPLLVEVENEEVPIIFIKEYADYIKGVKDDVIVGVKNSIIGDKKAEVFLLMLRFGGDECMYDIWFNYGFPWHADFLNKLTTSNRILIDFRDEDNERIKTIQIENTIGDSLHEYIANCNEEFLVKGSLEDNVISIDKKKKYECWKDDDVYYLMDQVFNDYDTIEDLWDNI